jgi:hypothetical protein
MTLQYDNDVTSMLSPGPVDPGRTRLLIPAGRCTSPNVLHTGHYY